MHLFRLKLTKETGNLNSKALQRQETIMDILENSGDVSAKKLADRLNVSIWTIRRDLNKLETRGILARYHGGASRVEERDSFCRLVERGSFRVSSIENQEAKQRIGLACARLLLTGNHVAMAGGTTTFEVAKALKKLHYKGEIVTNALDIALELAEQPEIRVVCTGGDVQPRYHTLVGADSLRMLKLHYFDVAVIGVSGISLKHGLTVYSQVNATALELMVEHSCRTIMVADTTKLGQVSFASLSLSEPIDCFVTDQPLPREYEQYFCELRTRIVVAEKNNAGNEQSFG
jgi:DeoR family transcriptional regulator, aga operon transcriptional repressor